MLWVALTHRHYFSQSQWGMNKVFSHWFLLFIMPMRALGGSSQQCSLSLVFLYEMEIVTVGAKSFHSSLSERVQLSLLGHIHWHSRVLIWAQSPKTVSKKLGSLGAIEEQMLVWSFPWNRSSAWRFVMVAVFRGRVLGMKDIAAPGVWSVCAFANIPPLPPAVVSAPSLPPASAFLI